MNRFIIDNVQGDVEFHDNEAFGFSLGVMHTFGIQPGSSPGPGALTKMQ
jgi:hypothetical protein